MSRVDRGNHPDAVRAILSLALLAFAAGACGSDEPAGPGPDDLLVLFIGSSYFEYNDLPGIFERLASESGKNVYVRREVASGRYLDYFAENAITEKVIQEQDWDYVLLQGGCQNSAYPETHHIITPGSGYHPVYPALETLKAKIEANHADSRTVYMMPWAFEDGMTWVEGMTDTYQDMQQKIYDNTLRWADSVEISVAPVGWAWYDVLAGDPPLHYLHLPDWNHPNLHGSYLSASVIFATVFVESVENVAYYGGLEQSEAEAFQEVASRLVLDSLELWNISPNAATQSTAVMRSGR
jgi:hypothetical protein